jgi:hypothetical protein
MPPGEPSATVQDARRSDEGAAAEQDAVTAVVTSCGRHDLLQQTLESFHLFNTMPVSRLLVVEDGEEVPGEVKTRLESIRIEWISTGRRVGQIAAIDYAYSRVRTPYIFHMEDDWEFYRHHFIERSLAVLKRNPKCLQVWIRAVKDTQKHPVEPLEYEQDGVTWRRLAPEYVFGGYPWHGFSFNPGLRRLRDYISIGGYGRHARFDHANPGAAESSIGKVFRRRDFYAAILADSAGHGYVRHIGRGRHVGAPEGASAT